MKHPIYLIVAVDKNMGIGKDGKLPWKFKNEIKFFKKITSETTDPTKQNLVIMGRSTWESIPEKFRPLPGRKNAVLTSQSDYQALDANIYHSFGEALKSADENTEKIFIIGGAKVFNEAISNPDLTGIYLTRIDSVFDCDTFFPKIPEGFSGLALTEEIEDGINISYLLYGK